MENFVVYKVIGVLILAGIGIMWLSVQISNSSAKNASKKVVDNLKTRKLSFESLAESLGMNIRVKALNNSFNINLFNSHLSNLNGKKLLDKFTIYWIEKSSDNKTIVIGEALVKEFIPTSESYSKEVDKFYPCWVFINIDELTKEITFKSSFPSDKEHQYLLEDLSDAIYEQCIK